MIAIHNPVVLLMVLMGSLLLGLVVLMVLTGGMRQHVAQYTGR